MKSKWQGGFCAALLVSAVGVTGCGGGGNSSPGGATTRSAPTAATKTRVQQLFGGSVRSLTQAGFQLSGSASTLNSGVAPLSAPAQSATGSTAVTSSVGRTSIPLVAAFLRNHDSATATKARAQRLTRRAGRDSTPIAPDPIATSDFYYDYYLGLWVATDDEDGKSVYQLYVDQAKTQPAGSIVTIWPTDYTVYPQTYQSTYSFTAGYLSGAHGTSTSVTTADGLSQTTYSDTYSDGSADSGASTYTSQGDSTWTGRTDATDQTWTTVRGSFRSDGSGGTHSELSDGYIADSTFNADGTGREKITGPDPGLPVTIVWDAYGNTTITYADGSTQFYAGWSSFVGDGGGTTNVDVPPTTSTGVATAGSSGSATSSSSPPTPPVTN